MSFEDTTFNIIGEYIFPALMWVLIGLLCLIPVACIREAVRPSFELKKDDWECTKQIVDHSTMYINSGGVMIPVPTDDKKCVQWSHRND